MDPQVSVIIPVLNEATALRRCLAALAVQDFPGQWEVLIVDNGSTDDLAAVAAALPAARVLHEPRTGSYAARNTGLSAARAPTIGFTDADCLPAPDWLTAGLQGLRTHAAAGAIAGAIEVFPRNPRRLTAAELYDVVHAFPQERYVRTYGFGATANLFTTRTVIGAVGPFDTSLRSGGDAEWGQRLLEYGHPVVYDPNVRVRHPARRTVVEVVRKTRRVVEGREELHHRRGGSRRTVRGEVAKSVRGAPSLLRGTWSHPRLEGIWDQCRLAGMISLVQLTTAAEALRQQRLRTERRHVRQRA